MTTDSILSATVLDKLHFDPRVSNEDISVAAHESIITLQGNVSSYGNKKLAESIIKEVPNVKGVVNELQIVATPSYGRKDTDIAKAIHNTWEWDFSVPEDKLQFVVENGHVTLSGNVEWYFQKLHAENILRGLRGVKEITNNIIVSPKVDLQAVKDKITQEFTRVPRLDAGNIQISSEGPKIILKGKVRSWAEREDAERVAWLVPGVVEVENNLHL